MKRLIILALIFFVNFISPLNANSEPLQGGVSIIDNIPTDIYGSWAVISVLKSSNTPNIVLIPHIDYWNIFKHNNVLTFENPQSGARASVTVNSVKNNTVTFSHQSNSQSENIYEETTETPTITILGGEFIGTDKFVIKKYYNGTLTQTDVIEFTIRGKKII